MCELGMRLRSVSRRHGEVLQSDTIVTPVPLNRLLRLLLKPTSLSPTAGPAPIAPIVARDAVKASGGEGFIALACVKGVSTSQTSLGHRSSTFLLFSGSMTSSI